MFGLKNSLAGARIVARQRLSQLAASASQQIRNAASAGQQQLSHRATMLMRTSESMSRLLKRQASTSSGSSGGSGPKAPRGSFSSRFVRGLFKFSIYSVVILASGYGLTYVFAWVRHPGEQLAHDPTKKTLMILGSGWAAVSLLQHLDSELYNIVMVSPRDYFLFTPLLPSCTVGTVEHRSIMQPIRYITRFKKREVLFYEAECTEIDPTNKLVTIQDNSEIKGSVSSGKLKYDYLVVATGAENQTFGIKGVKEYACFLKEIWDARKIRTRLMDCLETATFPNQSKEEVERLLHMVVVGGGPTGVEYAAELHDFLAEDLIDWFPDLSGKVRISLVEALPNVLPAFSKSLIEYTESTFKQNNIEVMTKTMVKEVREKEIVIQDPSGNLRTIPYGLLVWATGNTPRPVVRDLMAKLGGAQTVRRGLTVEPNLAVKGAADIFALGDVTATNYAPTAQVAEQQGRYLASCFNKRAKAEIANKEYVDKAFEYTHWGSLAYIGSDRAIADLPFNIRSAGLTTFYFWRSAYLSTLFSLRNKVLVLWDWGVKKNFFGRDIGRE